MFENLLAQPASSLLIQDFTSGTLPPSILFSGAAASGKLTCALELARIVSCLEGTADWTCTCSSCRKHRLLLHPDLLLAGAKDCLPEIKSAARAYLRSGKAASRFLFIRSIRKLVLRFDTSMYQGDESRYGKALSFLESLSEGLEEFEQLTADGANGNAAVEKKVEALVTDAEKLETAAMYESIPVSMIRRISSWSHLAPYGRKKVVVIEQADRMQDSARNAFLKILEEPPQDLVFILTTSRRGAILPTILSRVRTYGFISRPLDVQQSVITRVFHDEPEGDETLERYFSRFLPVSPAHISGSAAAFLRLVTRDAISEGRNPPTGLDAMLAAEEERVTVDTLSELVAGLNKCKPDSIWRKFLASVTDCLSVLLRGVSNTSRDAIIHARWNDAIRLALAEVDTYNISPVAALEKLSVEMRNAL